VTWSTDRGPSKTNKRQLCTGNAGNRSTVRTLLSDSALALVSRSTGLGGMVEEPRARFHVAEWGVFSHTARLRNSPIRLKFVLSDNITARAPPANMARRFQSAFATISLRSGRASR